MPNLHDPEPSEELLAGRRALEGIPGLNITEDWAWYRSRGCFALQCSLAPEINPDGPVPKITKWYILADLDYPWGNIVFYPAQIGGITQTFPHQNYNGKAHSNLPWRTGRLCVDTSMHVLGRAGYDVEPYSVEERLQWHARRALEWLTEASFGRLLRPGDPYELPHLPASSKIQIGFNEGPETFSAWKTISNRTGLATLALVPGAKDTLYIRAFSSTRNEVLLTPTWGTQMSGVDSEDFRAGWIRLNDVPVTEPWQAPKTWGELKEACRCQGLDIYELLKSLAPRLRDSLEHILLVGAPIPEVVGEQPRQMHWLALKIPVLSIGPHPGFRSNEEGRWRRDVHLGLAEAAELEWRVTENWSQRELSGRGKLSDSVTQSAIVIVGLGALGSAVAEQLVRAGSNDLVLVDGEDFQAGNTVRHTLTIDSIGNNKALSLAGRLNLASPHTKVEAISTLFPPLEAGDISKLRGARIVIDCTGKDEVLSRMGRFDWSGEKVFLSLSLGLQAKRLFFFSASAATFPHEEYFSIMDPWLRRELDENEGLLLPRVGTGCWHPLFPARIDDIWMMAAAGVKLIEQVLSHPSPEPELTVLEQVMESGNFAGIKVLASGAAHAGF